MQWKLPIGGLGRLHLMRFYIAYLRHVIPSGDFPDDSNNGGAQRTLGERGFLTIVTITSNQFSKP